MKRRLRLGEAARATPAVPPRLDAMTPDGHGALIRRLAPDEDPAHVEAWILHEHGTLDNVEPIHFAREVKRAVARIHARGPQESEQLARRYGLRPPSCRSERRRVSLMASRGRRLSRGQLLRIVEIQNEIAATRRDLAEVMQLVADRAADMTAADAGVLEIPDGDELVHRATSGAATHHTGLRLQSVGSLSGMCLRDAVTLRCDDAAHDERVEVARCRAAGVRSLLCVPLLHHGRVVVGVLTVLSARPDAFDEGHAELLQLLSGMIAAHLATTAELERLDAESRRNQRQAVAGLRALARAIDAKDPMTRQHSDRVAELAGAMAHRLGWCEQRRRVLHETALLHDVGKIGVPDSILLKPDRLTAEEYARVKEHAALGATIVQGVLTAEQSNWIRWHHERPDGNGYPDALTDAAIPEGAAIIALADTWDVMTISRPYSPPMDPVAALDECIRLAGRQFRARHVEILTELV